MLIIIALTVSLISRNEAAKILSVFPIPSISHQVVFRPLTQELAKQGHHVVVITTDPAFPKGQTPENLTEIDIHEMAYKKWELLFKLTPASEKDVTSLLTPTFAMLTEIFEKMIEIEDVQTLIKEETFDLLILEAAARPTLILSHVFKVPVILISSLGPINFNAETIGAPTHPILYPSVYRQKFLNLSNWEKLTEMWNSYRIDSGLESTEHLENEVAKRHFGQDVPSINELKNNVDMLFLNVHPIWDANRPTPPNVVYLGGLHQKPFKELPKDLQNYLDGSKNGVIYMSFGTNIKPSMLLSPVVVTMFIKVFSQLPYDVLWKWDTDNFTGLSDNIKLFKWLPQSDLLRHPKIKVFITQGGLQSTDEAITAGVPLIGIPILGDQWYNVDKYVLHNIGLKLDLGTITEEQIKNAINTVIGDDSYRRNIVRLRSLMADQPQRPLERAVWWTEYVLRHGGAKHLRAPSANMPWTEYIELELVLIVLGIFLATVLTSVFILCIIVKFISQILYQRKKIKRS